MKLMDRLNLRGASRIIISGLMARGYSLAAIQRAGNISAAALVAMMDGRRELSDVQMQRLESMSGMTVGQLGAFALEPNGGPLSGIMQELASARPAKPSPRANRSKGAKKLQRLSAASR
jgi:hypothetical protein